MDKQSKGKLAEKLAADHMQKQGYKLIDKNYHCRFGEIDIICQKQNCLVFVEVRFRSQSNYGGAFDSVTQQKQLKIIKSAESYLQTHSKFLDFEIRFDVIGIDGDVHAKPEWIQSAFTS